jgi:hypothetical protein
VLIVSVDDVQEDELALLHIYSILYHHAGIFALMPWRLKHYSLAPMGRSEQGELCQPYDCQLERHQAPKPSDDRIVIATIAAASKQPCLIAIRAFARARGMLT